MFQLLRQIHDRAITSFLIDPMRTALEGVLRGKRLKARRMTESRADREARLKAALRENLKKRKQQARAVPERDPGEPTREGG